MFDTKARIMRSVILFLLLLCSSNAFVVLRPSLGRIVASPKQQRNMILDPSHFLETVSTLLADADAIVDPDAVASSAPVIAEPTADSNIFSGDVSYSRASYYTILALYVLSFPGLISTVKRSTTAKVKRMTFVSAGEATGGKDLRQQAGEIMAYMKSNNYEVVEAGETIVFRGIVERSLSQAFFLTFCTAIGFASLALVLQIQFQGLVLPGIGEPNWFLITLLAPYAGIYYWNSGDRVDDCSFRLESNDEETENSITVQGSEEELDRMWRAMGWREKGKIKIPGLLDSA